MRNCIDCGNLNLKPSRARSDVCEDCAELRGQIVERIRDIDPNEFRELQRVLASQSGGGAGAMRRILGLDAPVI